MSHHLDTLIARQDIRLDITDLYVFRRETGTVISINVCHSIFGPTPKPGYHPEGMDEFKVDLNDNAVEEITHGLSLTNMTNKGCSATSCAASRVRKLWIRMRLALHKSLYYIEIKEGAKSTVEKSRRAFRCPRNLSGDHFFGCHPTSY